MSNSKIFIIHYRGRFMDKRETYTDKDGYLRYTDSDRLVHRHRAYKHIYRHNKGLYPYDFSAYVIHHKNRNKKDNRISNLAIMTPEEHEEEHGGGWISNENPDGLDGLRKLGWLIVLLSLFFILNAFFSQKIAIFSCLAFLLLMMASELTKNKLWERRMKAMYAIPFIIIGLFIFAVAFDAFNDLDKGTAFFALIVGLLFIGIAIYYIIKYGKSFNNWIKFVIKRKKIALFIVSILAIIVISIYFIIPQINLTFNKYTEITEEYYQETLEFKEGWKQEENKQFCLSTFGKYKISTFGVTKYDWIYCGVHGEREEHYFDLLTQIEITKEEIDRRREIWKEFFADHPVEVPNQKIHNETTLIDGCNLACKDIGETFTKIEGESWLPSGFLVGVECRCDQTMILLEGNELSFKVRWPAEFQ